MKKMLQLLFIGMLTSSIHTYCVEFSSTVQHQNYNKQIITIHFQLAENEAILANSLHASIDHPGIKIDNIEIHNPSVKKYLPEFHQKNTFLIKIFQYLYQFIVMNHTPQSMRCSM